MANKLCPIGSKASLPLLGVNPIPPSLRVDTLFSATLLRNSLKEVRETLDPSGKDAAFDRMVLVSYSMGGLLSKMMVQDSGDIVWDTVFDRSLETVLPKIYPGEPMVLSPTKAPILMVAISEKIIKADHNVHTYPAGIIEVRRILHEHLCTVDNNE